MNMAAITIEIPESLPDQLHETKEQFAQEAKLAMAIKLFELGRLSSGIAAQIAGLDRVTFLLRLHEFSVPMVNMTAEELALDITNA
jgi:predicted HTH domain antitoxin